MQINAGKDPIRREKSKYEHLKKSVSSLKTKGELTAFQDCLILEGGGWRILLPRKNIVKEVKKGTLFCKDNDVNRTYLGRLQKKQ